MSKYIENVPEDILTNYPEKWPPKEYYVNQNNITKETVLKFEEKLNSGVGERKIDEFLKKNLPIISNSLQDTGNHGSWVLSQQEIKIPTKDPGQVPDYIIGGLRSGGYHWWVIDLKSPLQRIFLETKNRVYFSSCVNKGVFQLLDYIDFCERNQSFLRENLGLKNLKNVKGLLLVGRESEFVLGERKQNLKSAWNELTGGKILIRTYDYLLRELKNKIDFLEKSQNK